MPPSRWTRTTACGWARRFCADVEEPELLELVTQTARLADRYDDDLIETFGQEVSLI